MKIENHLLNIRADDRLTFEGMLGATVEMREAILATVAALGASQKPEQARPAPARQDGPFAIPGASSREMGPIQLEGVEVKKAGRDLVPFKNPLYIVKWEGGSATTFDTLVGKAAIGFWSQGHPCYVTVEPSPKNPKYTNLVSIRMAA